jgi:hypothetical protein
MHDDDVWSTSMVLRQQRTLSTLPITVLGLTLYSVWKTRKMKFLSATLLVTSASAFNTLSFQTSTAIPSCSSSLMMSLNNEVDTSNTVSASGMSRRVALSAAVGLSAVLGQAQPSFAGTAPPTKEELERIKIGYKQIQYLLDNFDQETTTCRENGGECKRDAEPIRRVLGLRSTTE